MNISIAIPDSALSDDSTKLGKSRKISEIARACAIFRIDTIYIYNESNNRNDSHLLVTILKYLETPPFLRKRLFPKVNELKYAGVLHPLKIPSHITPANPKKIKDGDIREGIVVSAKGKYFVDFGINHLIPYHGRSKIGKRITAQFKKGFPDFEIKEIFEQSIPEYWGYKVKERGNLFSLISSWTGNIILTSRKGKAVTNSIIKNYSKSKEPLLLVFGSPTKGIHEILGSRIKQIQNARVLNFFPSQATETIRLEEAILGTLTVLNIEQNVYN
ncbi:MAG TPA: putative RNA uridine N3 methyltransferase [Nitrosopumilaceae archaeon]|nr:putative RNA uridine N3 methyltransferase [Nitrosopumilaceae archaeon]